MLVTAIIGILFIVLTSNGTVAYRAANNSAALVDMGIYELAVNDYALEHKTVNDVTLETLRDGINANIDKNYFVSIMDGHLVSDSKSDSYGELYHIYTDDFINYTIVCNGITQEFSVRW